MSFLLCIALINNIASLLINAMDSYDYQYRLPKQLNPVKYDLNLTLSSTNPIIYGTVNFFKFFSFSPLLVELVPLACRTRQMCQRVPWR